jgi:hypothetical protein
MSDAEIAAVAQNSAHAPARMVVVYVSAIDAEGFPENKRHATDRARTSL